MMEEVNDDPNGESTFEFIGRKGDYSFEEGLSHNVMPVSNNLLSSGTSANISNAPIFLPIDKPTEAIATQSEVPMYNASQYVRSPGDIFQPPVLSPPSADSTQSKMPENIQHVFTPNTEPSSSQQQDFSKILIPDYSVAFPSTLENVSNEEQKQNESKVWNWIKSSQILNKMAEKAKNSVDSVITTLDPGMKEIINTGGDVYVIVASTNEVKVSAVREAFQQVFGKATVHGMPSQSCSIAPQPVGFSAGLKAAEERIENLKQNGILQPDQIVLAVENFITELTPENWFDMGCLLLQDFNSSISLQVYTEAIPISSHFVQQAKDGTPADYLLGWSGYAITIGQVIGSALGVHHSEWHQALTGIPRRDILFFAAKTLAGLYKNYKKRCMATY